MTIRLLRILKFDEKLPYLGSFFLHLKGDLYALGGLFLGQTLLLFLLAWPLFEKARLFAAFSLLFLVWGTRRKAEATREKFCHNIRRDLLDLAHKKQGAYFSIWEQREKVRGVLQDIENIGALFTKGLPVLFRSSPFLLVLAFLPLSGEKIGIWLYGLAPVFFYWAWDFARKYPLYGAGMERIQSFYRELKISSDFLDGHLPLPHLSSPLAFRSLNMPSIGLKEFNFVFPTKKSIAVLGLPEGKEIYLGQLLQRVLEPISGKITLSGKDIREFKLEDLHRLVQVVAVEGIIFPGTLKENLVWGCKEEKTEEELFNALAAADGKNIYEQISGGWNQKIRPEKLLAAEAKKIHLARAFLQTEGRVFFFDSPTQELDGESAAVVLQSLRALAEKRELVFWTSRSPKEYTHADYIFFFSSNRNPVFSTQDKLNQWNSIYQSAHV